MDRKNVPTIGIAAAVLAALAGHGLAAQDKYTVKVPGGLTFSEFRGYEGWQVVSTSMDGDLLAAIVANLRLLDPSSSLPSTCRSPSRSSSAQVVYEPLPQNPFCSNISC